ncbi:hypothetical protein BO94DRAFT_537829 [Aspergillus sclerotioniger CBS 115572]|uniref:Secreted protein n=1 Tax=Aspergillus sclerotioniger CBS 115572 TaxID=1450535 RepID=A0A317VWA3_9EURO|nr:hypothetical protein BO94DRAFT_537829 [Aspergillus sclerotioniger CBS 115572]PWY78055.1 hypothetical protein BO94DRAFT_537829 [Aspergillus sclerotioniger CBS 115572]
MRRLPRLHVLAFPLWAISLRDCSFPKGASAQHSLAIPTLSFPSCYTLTILSIQAEEPTSNPSVVSLNSLEEVLLRSAPRPGRDRVKQFTFYSKPHVSRLRHTLPFLARTRLRAQFWECRSVGVVLYRPR